VFCANALQSDHDPGGSVSRTGYLRRRIGRFALVLALLVAIGSMWFFAEFDLDQCVAQAQRAFAEGPAFSQGRLHRFPPQECDRTDLLTDFERVLTGREHVAFRWASPGPLDAFANVRRSGEVAFYAMPIPLLWVVLICAVGILAADQWLRRQSR
jgi:hypothetical protein